MSQPACHAKIDVHFLNDVDWQADGAGLIHDGAFDRLPNPPGCVGGKTESAFRIELFDCMYKPEVAFLDEVEQRQTPIEIPARYFHNQAQIAFDHSTTCRFVPSLCTPREINFFLGRQQRRDSYFIQIQAGSIVVIAGWIAGTAAVGFYGSADLLSGDEGSLRARFRARIPPRVQRYLVPCPAHAVASVPEIPCCRVPVRAFLFLTFQRRGRYESGSTGWPSRRISKCNTGVFPGPSPISAIF